MKTAQFFIFIPCFIIYVNAAVQFSISEISIDFKTAINQIPQSCFGPTINFDLLLSTSNTTTQNNYFIVQQDGSQSIISFPNNTDFSINTPTDFFSLSGVISITCSSSSPIVDSFSIYSQLSTQPDSNGVTISRNVYSAVNRWFLNAKVFRGCVGGGYGFNCDQQCIATDNTYYCYTCEANGQKRCCDSLDVDPNYCSYYNNPTTTTSIYTTCDSSQETLYFWFMIGFVIATFILLVIVILLILAILGCFGRSSSANSQTEQEWINGPVDTRAKRHLYDGDLDRRYERKTDTYVRNRDSPYIVGREGLENQSYYDDTSIDLDAPIPPPKREVRV